MEYLGHCKYSETPEIIGFGDRGCRELEELVLSLEAVSYTHLDVYMRQLFMTSSAVTVDIRTAYSVNSKQRIQSFIPYVEI